MKNKTNAAPAPELPRPAKVVPGLNGPGKDFYTADQLRAYARAAVERIVRDAALEEAAKVCEKLGNEWCARNPRNQHHTGGGIGALSCAAAIRALKGKA